ncbi:MAG: FecR domain-containing protein [Pseudomonadota bacterium]|nr:FecR domain-containing protein [Pseudomonadota bacterium]
MKPISITAPGVDAVDEAAGWLARLDAPDCSPADRAGFEDWLAQSPGNIDSYLEMERVQAMASSLASDPMVRAATRKARRDGGTAARVRGWLPALAAMAATVVIALGVVLWVLRPPVADVTRYATAVGEQRALQLADGTRVLLDTDSALTASFTGSARRVELHRGRAQFVVAQDPNRGFQVRAGPALIRDIGTTFQASHVGGDVVVGLLEGAVIVSVAPAGSATASRRLSPGQQVVVARQGLLQPVREFDLATAEAWPRGELVFKSRRLDALLVEMNRYSRTPIRLADPRLGEITVSGVFHIGDQSSLVAALEQGWPVRAERGGATAIVLHPTGSSALE